MSEELRAIGLIHNFINEKRTLIEPGAGGRIFRNGLWFRIDDDGYTITVGGDMWAAHDSWTNRGSEAHGDVELCVQVAKELRLFGVQELLQTW